MKRDTVNYFLVGCMVLAAFALLMVTLFAMTGRAGRADLYHVHYGNVAGIGFGTPVLYEGFRIGEVRGVEPDRSGARTRYRVEIAVREGWRIPADSVAELQSSGLLADVLIGIREGDAPESLAVGAEIIGREGGDVFAAVNELASEVTVLTREKLVPLVDRLGERVDSITQALDTGTPELIDSTQALLGKLNDGASSVNELLGQANRDLVAETLTHARTISVNIVKVSEDLNGTRAEVDALLGELKGTVGETRPALREAMLDLNSTLASIAARIDSITHHINAASRNFDEFSREIRHNPNRLLFTAPNDEVEVEE